MGWSYMHNPYTMFWIYICIYICICLCIYVCMYIYMYVHIYAHFYKDIHRHIKIHIYYVYHYFWAYGDGLKHGIPSDQSSWWPIPIWFQLPNPGHAVQRHRFLGWNRPAMPDPYRRRWKTGATWQVSKWCISMEKNANAGAILKLNITHLLGFI